MTTMAWICYTDAVNGFRGAVSREGVAISYDTRAAVQQARALAAQAKEGNAQVQQAFKEMDAPESVQQALRSLVGNPRDLDRLHRRAPAAEAILSHPTIHGVLLVRQVEECATLDGVRRYTTRVEAATNG